MWYIGYTHCLQAGLLKVYNHFVIDLIFQLIANKCLWRLFIGIRMIECYIKKLFYLLGDRDSNVENKVFSFISNI